MTTVVDLSKYQGVIPVATFIVWRTLGIQRVIIKAGGGDDGIYKDSDHDANVANARAAGLGVDHYWFNGPASTLAAQVTAFHTYANPQPGDIMWFDIESEGTMPHWSNVDAINAGTQLHALWAGAWGVYMSASVVPVVGSPSLIALGALLWVASYGTNNGAPQTPPAVAPWAAYVYWQYTSTGKLPDYAGNLDLNNSGTQTPPAEQDYEMTSYELVKDTSKNLWYSVNRIGRYLIPETLEADYLYYFATTLKNAPGAQFPSGNPATDADIIVVSHIESFGPILSDPIAATVTIESSLTSAIQTEVSAELNKALTAALAAS